LTGFANSVHCRTFRTTPFDNKHPWKRLGCVRQTGPKQKSAFFLYFRDFANVFA
jgi:hypothetical protein